MEKEELIEQTISDLNNLSTYDLIQLKKIIDNIKQKLNSDNKLNNLEFNWEGALSNEDLSSVELQKEALNWR